MNACKVVLRGIGETEIRFISEDAFGWVINPDPGIPDGCTESSWDDQTCPPSVRSEILSEIDVTFGDEQGVYITRGSWQNDRAIIAPVIDIDGEIGYFFREDHADEWASSHGLHITDTYEGVLY